ncbi:MAG TPA: hypothetical protein VGF32_12235 [Streptosporangiaceae bacterium]
MTRLTTEQMLERNRRQAEIRAKIDAPDRPQLTYEDAVDADPGDLMRAIDAGQLTSLGYGPGRRSQ